MAVQAQLTRQADFQGPIIFDSLPLRVLLLCISLWWTNDTQLSDVPVRTNSRQRLCAWPAASAKALARGAKKFAARLFISKCR